MLRKRESKTGRSGSILIVVWITILFATGCILQTDDQVLSQFEGTLEALDSVVDSQSTQLALQATYISHLATRGPAATPSTPQPMVTPNRPVVGSVVIAEGQCCAGGIAGSTITLSVWFEASSPFGEITHMRVLSGMGPVNEEILQTTSQWELYQKEQTFVAPVALNWTGFYVSAQFRDSTGNLSPVVWDDISIEGQPAPTP
jgi:hypothetical protein